MSTHVTAIAYRRLKSNIAIDKATIGFTRDSVTGELDFLGAGSSILSFHIDIVVIYIGVLLEGVKVVLTRL